MRTTLNLTSLNKWLALLEKRHPNAVDLGLSRVSLVAGRLGVLPPAARVITVAGTNGKGSCVAFLEQMLLSGNVKNHGSHVIGCYTSPHLTHYNERIRVAGVAVDDEIICRAFASIDSVCDEVSLTYFEYGTLAALLIFQQLGVDIVLLEVGLGGRLDAVNIVDADVAVITSIDLDHQDWLGQDRESIAVEKAGIARAARPLVCGEEAPPATLLPRLDEIGAEVSLLGSESFCYRIQGKTLNLTCTDQDGRKLHYTGLACPQLPLVSACCAVQALVCSGMTPDQDTVLHAFAETQLAGRFQHVRFHGRDIVLDVAHNPAATGLLADRLQGCLENRPGARVHGLFGVLADKDISGMIIPLISVITTWYVSDLDNVPRAAKAAEIAAVLHGAGLDALEFPEIAEALLSITGAMGDNDLLVIFGSFYTVGEAMQVLDGEPNAGWTAG